jgi:hypothetical protein
MVTRAKKPQRTRKPSGPSHGRESDSERETGSTTHQSTELRPNASTTARQDDEKPFTETARRPTPWIRRPGHPSEGGISGGGSDEQNHPDAQAGHGDHQPERGHPYDDPYQVLDAESHNSEAKPTPKPKPDSKPKHKKKGDQGDENRDVSSDEEQSDEKSSESSNENFAPEDLEKSPEVKSDEDKKVQKVDPGEDPKKNPVGEGNNIASSEIPDAFDDEGDDHLPRIQRRINAIRKGGHSIGVALADDDPELELVDLSLAEKCIITAEKQRRRKRNLMVNDSEMGNDIVNALAETLRPKWPEYIAMGFKVAFFIGDLAMIVSDITEEFILVDICVKEIIMGAVNLYNGTRETSDEKAATLRNGRGDPAIKLKERQQKGQVALVELTGVKALNTQQLETYNRLRVLLALERKAALEGGT